MVFSHPGASTYTLLLQQSAFDTSLTTACIWYIRCVALTAATATRIWYITRVALAAACIWYITCVALTAAQNSLNRTQYNLNILLSQQPKFIYVLLSQQPQLLDMGCCNKEAHKGMKLDLFFFFYGVGGRGGPSIRPGAPWPHFSDSWLEMGQHGPT